MFDSYTSDIMSELDIPIEDYEPIEDEEPANPSYLDTYPEEWEYIKQEMSNE